MRVMEQVKAFLKLLNLKASAEKLRISIDNLNMFFLSVLKVYKKYNGLKNDVIKFIYNK